MKLTACLITKNEERCLARCLASLRDAVDAIVVVDTGSADRTREIARDWGARIIEISWRDDFAWAKNQALMAADGDWVLFPDADEYFDPGGAAALRAWLESCPVQPEPDGVAIRRYEGIRFPASSYTSVLRVFRLLPDLRYTGVIHEEPRLGGKALRIADAPPESVYLWHDGSTPERAGAKIKRNLRIITEHIKTGNDDPLLLFHLSKTLDRQKEREQIWKYSSEFLRRDASPSSVCLKAMILAGMALDFTPDPASALEGRTWLKGEALRRFPRQPAAYCLAGDECLERGDWVEALRMYTQALRLWETGFDDFGDSDFRQEGSRSLLYARLGRCRQMTGDIEGARADFAAALDLRPDSLAAVAGYIECSQAENARIVAGALSVWQARARSPLNFLAVAREKRCDMLYLYLYDQWIDKREYLSFRYFSTMQVLIGTWWAAATDCCDLLRRHPLWAGDPLVFWSEIAEPERTELSETATEAVVGCLLAVGDWQGYAAGEHKETSPDPVSFLRALAAVVPPALNDAIRLCLGEEVAPARREGGETVWRIENRLKAFKAPEQIRRMWREVLACMH
jgi:tetratricopeptide (TPR) repeat protein